MRIQNWTYDHAKHHLRETEAGATRRRLLNTAHQTKRNGAKNKPAAV